MARAFSLALICFLFQSACTKPQEGTDSEAQANADDVLTKVETPAQPDTSGLPAFDRYLSTIPMISVPYTVDLSTDGNRYDYGEFGKFKSPRADQPFARLTETEDHVLILDMAIGSNYYPIFVLYDRQGNILDELYKFQEIDKNVDPDSYERTDAIRVTEKEIIVHMQTTSWTLNGDKTDRIAGSEKLTHDTAVFVINDGKFKVKD